MKPEARIYLEQAHQCLGDAAKSAEIGLFRIAVREAYLAAFHAAQAAIFDDTGKVAKTHSGVRTEFARIAGRYGARESRSTKFLADAYQWKEAADYDPAMASATFDRFRTDEAMEGARRLIEQVEAAIGARAS